MPPPACRPRVWMVIPWAANRVVRPPGQWLELAGAGAVAGFFCIERM